MSNTKFQSSPSPKAGSYLSPKTAGLGVSLFQSSPSPKAGSYFDNWFNSVVLPGFNPLPARRPGATRAR